MEIELQVCCMLCFIWIQSQSIGTFIFLVFDSLPSLALYSFVGNAILAFPETGMSSNALEDDGESSLVNG